jgi:hypothetical protein
MITPAGSATQDQTPPGASPPRPREADRPSAPIEHLIHVIPDISTRAYLLLLGAAVLLGTIVRASHVLASDFPLNDGGMFYAMARDLQQHGFTIPATTSYNSADIPFAYPPLGFYLAALLDRVLPGGLLEMFRVLPLLYSAATLVAFAMLAHRMLSPRAEPAGQTQQAAVIGATVAFALIPRSFLWLIMGGGVARGLGLAFALVALHEAHRLYTERNTSEGDTVGRPEPRYVLTTAIAFAGCVLSHVETGWFLGFSIVIFWLAYGRTRRTFVYSIAIAALGLALTAPWWMTVALQHGLRPFIEANASGGNVLSSSAMARETFLSLARITSTSEPFFPLIGAIALLGGLAALRARHFVLPLWWVAIILLDLRAYPTFTTIPVAMLAGIGIAQIVLPLAHLVWDRPLLSEPVEHDDEHNELRTTAALAPWHRVSRGAVLLTIGLLLYSTVGALLRAPGFAGEAAYLVGLTHNERNAMQWIRTNTAEDARILIVPRGPWQVDKEAEWFPVLANRVSVGTVQGTEWTHSFEDHVRSFDQLWQCGYKLSDCLSSWSLETGTTYTHVWVPRTEQGQCCSTLVASLRDANAYRVVYDGPGGTVFTYRATSPSTLASSVPLFSPVAASR